MTPPRAWEEVIPNKIVRVGFNGRPFCQNQIRGLGRHTLELILALRRSHPSWEFFIYSNGAMSENYKRILDFAHFREEKIRPKILWDLWYLGHRAKRDRLSIFHSTNNLGVPFFFFKKFPIFTTIHDHFTHVARSRLSLSFAGFWSWFSYVIEFLVLKRSTHFFTVSEDAKGELVRRLHLQPQSITVAYNGTNLATHSSRASKPRFPYHLYVGGLEARKDVETLLKAFKIFSGKMVSAQKLILVGQRHSATPEVRRLLEDDPLLFELIEEISDPELAELYIGAKALVFPSTQEGFGLPLIEAMSLGCPVIASSIDVFREIGEQALLTFTVKDVNDLCSKLLELEHNPALAQTLREAGLIRSKRFTWDAMADVVSKRYLKTLPLVDQVKL